MSRLTPRRILRFSSTCLRLKSYLNAPGDGRVRPRIGARPLVWSLLIGSILRETSFHAIEALVCSRARRALAVAQSFGDDALSYFTARLCPGPTRHALATALRQAKRNKAFDNSRFIGIAVDGSSACRCSVQGCELCRPFKNKQGEVAGYQHHVVMASIVGTGLSLPLDVEPYGPGDSEYSAAQRLLARAVQLLGCRFAQYVVADGEYATAPFLHHVGELRLRVVARLKANLPELWRAAQTRFAAMSPTSNFQHGRDRVEVWDAEDFDPWNALRWVSVRVLRYRQHKPDGSVVEAYWLTDFPASQVSSQSLFHMAKSRWEIENQGFNDAKNRHGFEHMAHHDANSLLVRWLLLALALTIERLFRLRHLRRGNHRPRAPIDLLRLLRLSLGADFSNSS